ncbi:MAG: hypothetical protein AUJ18_04390 [Candidatus Hydrogenedentes bacterium CG1_02_42_14]|nr:MAG: hypothetical protein AUJ18_04390 [Candidatus Hydrogenedentes bacterium CG1_02_42_14]
MNERNVAMKRNTNEDFKWKLTKIHFGVIGAAMIFALSLLAQNTQYRDFTNKLVSLNKEKRELMDEKTRLTIKREALSDPIRIRSIAVEKYGMVGAEPNKVHEIESSSGVE